MKKNTFRVLVTNCSVLFSIFITTCNTPATSVQSKKEEQSVMQSSKHLPLCVDYYPVAPPDQIKSTIQKALISKGLQIISAEEKEQIFKKWSASFFKKLPSNPDMMAEMEKAPALLYNLTLNFSNEPADSIYFSLGWHLSEQPPRGKNTPHIKRILRLTEQKPFDTIARILADTVMASGFIK